MRKHSLAGVGMVLAAAAAAPLAASEADSKLLEILRARGTITEAEYQELKGIRDDETQKAAASDIKVSTKGGIKIESGDGANSVTFGGRLHLDAAAIDKDELDVLDSGVRFRRVRPFIEGQIASDWRYKLEVDFSENTVEAKEIFIHHQPTGLKVGHFKMPSSLEELTSSNYITLMERSLPNALALGFRTGLGWGASNEMGSLALGAFGQGAGSKTSSVDEEGFGIAGRVTAAPINGAGSLLHLGAWGSREQPTDTNTETFRVRQRPESRVADQRLVDTGTMLAVDDLTRWGVEAATAFGPLSIQGEYLRMDVARNSGFDDLDFSGWYVFASWLLTGESRPYKTSNGTFDRIKPAHPVGKGGWGAWELALRRSSLDLNDGSVSGGEIDNLTFGVNWYLTDFARVMLNYIRTDADVGQGVANGFGVPIGFNDEPNILQARFQIDWK